MQCNNFGPNVKLFRHLYQAGRVAVPIRFGCSFFAYSWKLPAYSGAFSLTVDNFSFFAYSWSFFTYSFSFSTYSWSFFAYSGKVRLIRALRGCKQRSSTVSKKAPTVSEKASPIRREEMSDNNAAMKRAFPKFGV